MRFDKTMAKTMIGAAAIAAAGTFGVAAATAVTPAIQPFGTSEQLIDGPRTTSYTVANLAPSTIVIPGYQPEGTIYQADLTARADSGTVTPLVNNFNARAANGETYRVINEVPAPNGINPGPIAQGDQASGKLYFDVTGPAPDGVVYNDGVEDVMIWTNKA